MGGFYCIIRHSLTLTGVNKMKKFLLISAAHYKNEMAMMTMELGVLLKYLTADEIANAHAKFVK